MSCFLYENYWGSPTLTLLNVHGVLGVLNVLNVLHVLHTCASCALYAHGRIVGLLGLVILSMGFIATRYEMSYSRHCRVPQYVCVSYVHSLKQPFISSFNITEVLKESKVQRCRKENGPPLPSHHALNSKRRFKRGDLPLVCWRL